MTKSVSIALGAALLACAAVGGSERVETIDLRSVEGNVVAVSAQKVDFLPGGKAQSVPLKDVEEIHLRDGEDLLAATARGVVQTAAGDLLSSGAIAVADGKLRFECPMIGAVEVPLTAVAYVYLPATGLSAGAVIRRCADVQAPEKAADTLVVDQGKEWSGVEGVLVSLKDQQITFRVRDEDKQIETRHVKAIRLASPASVKTPAGTVLAADGSEIHFSSLRMEGQKVVAQTLFGPEVTLERKNVAAVRFFSDRAVALSSLTPEKVQEHGFFDTKFPHRLNKSVDGGPLKMAGKTHASGLGMNSLTELTYKLDGPYKSFVAVAGIDDAVRPNGNATLTFLGDGKPLREPVNLTGKADPVEVRLDLSGVKSLLIRVDFGPDNLPVGDHVDLGSARLIK